MAVVWGSMLNDDFNRFVSSPLGRRSCFQCGLNCHCVATRSPLAPALPSDNLTLLLADKGDLAAAEPLFRAVL